MPKDCPILKLSDAISRSTSEYSAPVSISEKGDKIYIVYDINVDNDENLCAELFENAGGNLITRYKLRNNDDNKFNIIDGGSASPDFEKFSLLDDDGISTARIRILNKKLKSIVEKEFIDYYGPGSSFNGGVFTDDGKYVQVSYVTNKNQESEIQKSVLRILKSDDLEQIAEFYFDGNTAASCRFFRLKVDDVPKQFIILPSTNGIYDAEDPNPKSPSILRVLKLYNGNISVVSEVNLPQECNYDLFKKRNKMQIVVGTRQADDINCTIPSVNIKESFLPHDGRELRFYDFDGHNLKLTSAKNTVSRTTAIFYPLGKYILLTRYTINKDSLGHFEIVKISKDKRKCIEMCNSSMANINQPKSEFKFSKDGKWLIVSGRRTNLSTADPNNLHNILLYKVITE